MSKKHLKHKLNMANKAVHDLMEEVEFWKKQVQLNTELAMETIGKQHEQHEKQMDIAENEIKRLNILIDFLYMRGRE